VSRTDPVPILRVGLLYDDSVDRPGGVAQYVASLAGSLRRRGHHVAVLAGASEARELEGCVVHSLARNVPVRFNGSAHTMPVLASRRRIRQLLRRESFDVIHVQVPYSPFLAGRVIAGLPSRVALVGTFHVASERALPRIGARLLSAVTQRSLARFDRIVSVSNCAAEFAATTYGCGPTQVVPNMIDSPYATQTPARRRASGSPMIVFLGALVPRKGPDRLIEAFALLCACSPYARLEIAGDGPLREALMRRTRRLGLTGSVRFHGQVSNVEKRRLFGSADIACFPSSFGESFGVVLLEAIAAGAGVVLAGDAAGYRELFADMPDAICRTDPRDIASRLHGLSDHERRDRLRAQQLGLLSRFDSSLVTAQVLDVYREALTGRDASVVSSSLALPIAVGATNA
jgi:phosphatidylinositol alpha-mannosyltransferase